MAPEETRSRKRKLISGVGSGRRTYNLYIMYSRYYRTPRLYLSGYLPDGQPLAPKLMMDDIVGDYKEKTVTLEDFPFFANNVKMASVHPCKHAPVMKTLLDRADAALKLRREKMKAGEGSSDQGMEGLVDEIQKLDVSAAETTTPESSNNEDWEEVEAATQEVAIRVDQYLVVFLKVRPNSSPFIFRPGSPIYHSSFSCLPATCFSNLRDPCLRVSADTSALVHRQCYTRHRARFHHGNLDTVEKRARHAPRPRHWF